MKKMNYTSIEQSKKLLELGLNLETADLVWSSVFYEGPPGNGDENLRNCYLDPITNHFYYLDLVEDFSYDDNEKKEYPSIPCWSLEALIEVMPDRIWGPDDEYGEPCAHELVFKAFGRTLEYKGILASDYRLSGAWFKQETDNLIDIFYNMVVWLLENDYIQK